MPSHQAKRRAAKKKGKRKGDDAKPGKERKLEAEETVQNGGNGEKFDARGNGLADKAKSMEATKEEELCRQLDEEAKLAPYEQPEKERKPSNETSKDMAVVPDIGSNELFEHLFEHLNNSAHVDPGDRHVSVVETGSIDDCSAKHQKEMSDLKAKIKTLENLKIENEKTVAEITRERDSLKAKLEGLKITTFVMSDDGRKEREMAAEIEYLKVKYKEKKELIRKPAMEVIDMVVKKEGEINALKANEQILVIELNRSQKEIFDLCGQIYYLQDQHEKEMVDLQAMLIKTLNTIKISNEELVADITRLKKGLSSTKLVMSEDGRKEREIAAEIEKWREMVTEIQSLNDEVHDLMKDHRRELRYLNGKIKSLKISNEKKAAQISHLFDENQSLKRWIQLALGEIISLRVDQLDSCHFEYP